MGSEMCIRDSFYGTGDNQLTGIYLQPVWKDGGPVLSIPMPKVVISAKNVEINAKSTNSNGKSVYGITSYTGTISIVDSDVSINVESNTERTGKQYSEVVGIGVATLDPNKPIFGTLEVSENSSITVVAKSNSSMATVEASDGKSDRSGGSPVYGMKLDAGQVIVKGSLNLTSTAVGADAYGLRLSLIHISEPTRPY